MKTSILTLSMILCLLMLSISQAQLADITQPNQKSSVPNDSRFEIVQSTISARLTFLLDKYTGIVYQEVKDKDGNVNWEEMKRIHKYFDTEANPNKANYQLFTSGLAVRFTFLTNINTGTTWVLTQDSETKEEYWAPMEIYNLPKEKEIMDKSQKENEGQDDTIKKYNEFIENYKKNKDDNSNQK